MAYPNDSYPTDPGFPDPTIYVGCDLNWYNVTTSYIIDITALMASMSDNAGHIDLATDKAIKWATVDKITCPAGTTVIDELCIDGPLGITGGLVVDTVILPIDTTMTLSGNLTVAGEISVENITGDSITIAQIDEPDDPGDNGTGVLWNSTGVGAGDVGDIMMKIKSGGVVKTTTLVDYSAL